MVPVDGSSRSGELSGAKEQRAGSLARALLDDPIPDDDQPGERWAYTPWDRWLVSLFIALHVILLIAYNTPATGLGQVIHAQLDRYAEMSGYMKMAGNTPSWGMFAPDPPRSNIFLKVLVEDGQGRVWDLHHDFYEGRRYPYLSYDRLRKVNERLSDEPKYQEPYAAWVCRLWEQTQGGIPAREVRFVRLWTRIPTPGEASGAMGYDPLLLERHEVAEGQFRCASLAHGQLPAALRTRYGLAAGP